MKRIFLTILLISFIAFNTFSQTTLTEDANGVLNTNKIVAQTTGGQIFFTGHQLGSGYSMPSGIFRAITDNTSGGNYFYDGLSGSTTTFSVRSDGQGYFAGNVGIGISNPTNILSVAVPTSGTVGDLAPLITGQKSGYSSTGGLYNTLDAMSPYAAGLAFKIYKQNVGIVEAMRISSAGNVGIGIINPHNMLDVNGIIHSKQVNVDLTGWSDYVFNKDYQLPTLTEIEAYINQNHHLAEIPSATEITKNGLDLGEMNKLLLKKVEELTLYLIEKDKEIKDQQGLNNLQREENNTQNETNKQQAQQLKSQQNQINKLSQQLEQLIKTSEKQ